MTQESHNSTVPQRSWFRRNWLWFLPVGCLTSIALFIGFIALIAYFVFSAIKSSEPYEVALQTATADPAVIEQLGQPIEAAFFAMGSIELKNSDGEADLSIPISGPKGKAILYVEATKQDGHWTYHKLAIEYTDTNQTQALPLPQ